MIAVLDAKPNCAGELAALVRRLTPHVRAEPGCLSFIPYRAQTSAGRIYIYEVYADADAFDAHLQADYVREFIEALPAVTTDGGQTAAVRLDVLAGAVRASDRYLIYGRSPDVRGVEGMMWPRSWMR